MVSHRAETHSLFCLPLIAIPLGLLGHLWGKKGRRPQWVHLAFWALVTHPLLDTFTSYGTQLLAPFDTTRFAWDGVGIIDFIYTFPLIYVAWMAMRKKTDRARSQKQARWILGGTTLYLFFGLLLSQAAIKSATERFKSNGFEPVAVRANPSLLFSFLRRVTARDQNGRLMTTAYSPFLKDAPVHLHEPPVVPQLEQVLDSEEGQVFTWFNDGFYSVHMEGSTLKIVDARYGFMSDPWSSPFAATVDLDKWPDEKIDIGAEFGTAWRLMWGQHTPSD
jgi:inner membrane protein